MLTPTPDPTIQLHAFLKEFKGLFDSDRISNEFSPRHPLPYGVHSIDIGSQAETKKDSQNLGETWR
jgi:hypothetical protein